LIVFDLKLFFIITQIKCEMVCRSQRNLCVPTCCMWYIVSSLDLRGHQRINNRARYKHSRRRDELSLHQILMTSPRVFETSCNCRMICLMQRVSRELVGVTARSLAPSSTTFFLFRGASDGLGRQRDFPRTELRLCGADGTGGVGPWSRDFSGCSFLSACCGELSVVSNVNIMILALFNNILLLYCTECVMSNGRTILSLHWKICWVLWPVFECCPCCY
jgi:hypothetical protein